MAWLFYSQSVPLRRADHYTLVGPEVLEARCRVAGTGILSGF